MTEKIVKDWKQAPLMIQFIQGTKGFQYNRTNPYHPDTMEYREWERGYNYGYLKNLEKLNG